MSALSELPADSIPTNNEETQEGITVAIRMRPLNHAEGNKQRVWKVLPQYSSIAQTTRDGKPLSERATGRTFFTFDKTFGEDTNTKQVYDNVAKTIVSSVVNGLNGTIFAYGQTSSGKTYTMQGAGSIQEGSQADGGIVHMAAKDIFSHISSQQDRIFLVRASFLEIYNEEVRDLLSNSNRTLKIREDPRSGVFVNSVEEIVTDFESLLTILFRGEKSRQIASTGMNERSSRSHTIFKITVESRQQEVDDDSINSDKENDSRGDGAVRVSTLNLVDLAGSESVRHTGATGDRQKEGGMINQSLLTLSRVIVALGTPNQMHINFRDSKLTRILQPSLSGNAKMAVICCATPSELYLEETRSTLQFASRAKLVKTNAQVNEVLDDRSIIRRLQRELAEARRNSSAPGTDHLRALENKAATAGSAAVEAKAKLDRLKASILNASVLFRTQNEAQINEQAPGQSDHSSRAVNRRKRRQSDGGLLLNIKSPTQNKLFDDEAPRTEPRRKRSKPLIRMNLSANAEIGLVREALSSRARLTEALQNTVKNLKESISDIESRFRQEKVENENKMTGLYDTLLQEQDMNELRVAESAAEREKLLAEEADLRLQYEDLRQKSQQLKDHARQLSTDNDSFRQQNDVLLSELESFKVQIENVEGMLRAEEEKAHALNEEVEKTEEQLNYVRQEKDNKESQLEKLSQEYGESLTILGSENEDLASRLAFTSRKSSDLEAEYESLRKENEELYHQISCFEKEKTDFESVIEETSLVVATQETEIKSLKARVEESGAESKKLESQCHGFEETILQLQSETNNQQEQLAALQATKSDLESQLESSKSESMTKSKENQTLKEELTALQAEKVELENQLALTQTDLDAKEDECKSLKEATTNAQQSISSLEEQLSETEAARYELESKVANSVKELESRESEKVVLENKVESLVAENSSMDEKLALAQEQYSQLVESNDQFKSEVNGLQDQLAALRVEKSDIEGQLSAAISESSSKHENNESLQAAIVDAEQRIIGLEKDLATAEERIEVVTTEKETFKSEQEEVLMELEGRLAESQKELETLESQVEHILGEKEKTVTESKEAHQQLEKRLAEVSKAHDVLESEKFDLESRVEELESGLDCQNQDLQDCNLKLKSEVEELKTKLSNAAINASEAESRLLEVKNSMTSILAEKDALSSILSESQLHALQLEQNFSEKEATLTEMTMRIDELSRESKDLIETRNQLQESERALKRTESELHSEIASKESLSKRLHEREMERDEATSELEKQYERNRELSRSLSDCLPKARETQLLSEVSELKTQNIELKQLLISANESEERSRNVASSLESEHNTKTRELDDALYRLSQLEEELRLSEMHEVNDDGHCSNELLDELKTLSREKAEIQRLLEQEREERHVTEEELKKRMGEEQRLLIHEAESRMTELRMNADQLQINLEQSESEGYRARQQAEELKDRNKEIEEKYMVLETTIADLQSSTRHQENQISVLQSELNKSKAESYALKESTIEIKDRMRKTSRENERVTRENQVASSEVAALKRKISTLERDATQQQDQCERMKLKLKKLEKDGLNTDTTQSDTIKELREAIKEKEKEIKSLSSTVMKLSDENKAIADVSHTVSQNDDRLHLQNKIDRLKDKMKQKDSRIKKLEAVRLTKEQVESIKKLKTDNINFEKKCTTLAREKAELQSQLASVGSGSAPAVVELSELRFDKEALESKLRKFAAHCQRLEDDKAGMIDALRSCKIEITEESDINDSIIALCDKLTSLEESKSRNSGTDDSERLETLNKTLLSRIEKAGENEQQLIIKIKGYEAKIDSLERAMQDTNESANGTKSEMSRKLQFLEQENLQLMVDNKSTKKQLQLAREEVEMMRMNAVDNPTMDFSTVDFGASTIDFEGSLVKSKETISLTPKVSEKTEIAVQPPRTTPRTFSAKKRSQTPLDDATNTRKKTRPPSGKKARLDMPKSDSEVKRSRTPGLGESAITDEENTAECKQS